KKKKKKEKRRKIGQFGGKSGEFGTFSPQKPRFWPFSPQIFSICAFAPCGGFGGSVSFLVSCAGEPNRTVTAAFEYPFRLNRAAFAPSLRGLCNGSVWTSDVHLVGDFSSGAQFFVAVAVLAFLYSLAALGLYVAFLPLYRGGRRLPMAVTPGRCHHHHHLLLFACVSG
uniref:MARVEL domain-containing protein n=1 Tax=Nothoprocta perdicaria TaxID=30464 RepID=A0A8C6Z5Z3_NOTPE